jgi:hypothetical protein
MTSPMAVRELATRHGRVRYITHGIVVPQDSLGVVAENGTRVKFDLADLAFRTLPGG